METAVETQKPPLKPFVAGEPDPKYVEQRVCLDDARPTPKERRTDAPPTPTPRESIKDGPPTASPPPGSNVGTPSDFLQMIVVKSTSVKFCQRFFTEF